MNVVLNGASFCEKQTVIEQIKHKLSLVIFAANFVLNCLQLSLVSVDIHFLIKFHN